MDVNGLIASGDNETNGIEPDTEAKPNPFLMYLTLFGLPLGVLMVVVPAMTVIVIVLKNRKLRKKNNNIFYVNLLITDIVATLVRWVFTSTIIICYLLDVPNVNCGMATVSISTSWFATRIMFLPVVIDRFLHIALPFSYKWMFTTKRIVVIISSLWLLSFVVGLLSLVNQDFTISPESGLCVPKILGFPLLNLIVFGTHVTSMAVITGICIYLRYKIIHSKRFFKSIKRNAAEEQKAVKVGRMMEILEEQVKPTLSVFIAGGIDAVFNVFAMIFNLIVIALAANTSLLNHVVPAITLCQYCSHAVVYGLRDKYIRKEVMGIYEKIRGPKKSKVIMLNVQ